MDVGSSLYEYDFKLVGDSDIKISDTKKLLELLWNIRRAFQNSYNGIAKNAEVRPSTHHDTHLQSLEYCSPLCYWELKKSKLRTWNTITQNLGLLNYCDMMIFLNTSKQNLIQFLSKWVEKMVKSIQKKSLQSISKNTEFDWASF